MRQGEIVVAQTAGQSINGFTDIQATGGKIYNRSSSLAGTLPPGVSVLAIRGPGRSIIPLGPGGYASAYPGE